MAAHIEIYAPEGSPEVEAIKQGGVDLEEFFIVSKVNHVESMTGRGRVLA